MRGRHRQAQTQGRKHLKDLVELDGGLAALKLHQEAKADPSAGREFVLAETRRPTGLPNDSPYLHMRHPISRSGKYPP
jgi:hypothetical protein